MKKVPLKPAQLYRRCDPKQFPFKTTAELEDSAETIGQARAFHALRFATGIGGAGYNVFALGPPGLGKHTAVREIVAREAEHQPVPCDWCYVHNFRQPHKPTGLRLPPGLGVRLRDDMDQLVEDLASDIPAAFESESYRARMEELEAELAERQSKAVEGIRTEAQAQHIALINTPAGFAFAPVGEDNNTIPPAVFAQLPVEEQRRMEETVRGLQERLQVVMRQFPAWQKETRAKIKALNREIAEFAVGHLIDAVKARYADLVTVQSYLGDVREEIIEHVDQFRGERETPGIVFGAAPSGGPPLHHFKVNVLVDHGESTAAPIVYENLPSHANLIGRIEHRAQMGTLQTDFTLIKPGALHRANGGYLVLDARKILTQPYAWESLKRTLESGEIRIEPLEQTLGLMSTTSLEPAPIPLEVKVVLMGERLLYYLLSRHDPDFRELFKVAADFEDAVARDRETSLEYAKLIGALARRYRLRHLDRRAVARVLEHSARFAGDAEKLSLHIGTIVDLMREADYQAQRRRRKVISAADVQCAIDQQIRRADRVRERSLEAISRGTLLIATEGATVGQINGLSVLDLGNFAFGRPTRITATVRLGAGKVIDIERETELGGSIHSKGVLILSSFLGSRYAKDKPLSFTASLVFEQSYGMVEGDSASLAELCAILSVLADLPIRQGLAVTGSVNQRGQVQPIGGVNEKIEGFFDVCEERGLDGTQAVLIPAANLAHLMLREAVVKAARARRFHVYAVQSVDEALELLTGVAAGRRKRDGTYPADSVNGRVERRLEELSSIRQRLAGRAAGKAGVNE